MPEDNDVAELTDAQKRYLRSVIVKAGAHAALPALEAAGLVFRHRTVGPASRRIVVES